MERWPRDTLPCCPTIPSPRPHRNPDIMAPEQPPATDRRALNSRPVFWLVAGAAVLVVALAVGAGWYLGADQGSSSAAPSAGASAVATPPVTPTETATSPTPSTFPPVAVVLIPADCTDIYTKDWTPVMGGLVLNPAWASDPAKSKQVATNEQGLATMLEANTDLYCKWGAPGGASDRGITTNLASLTSEQQAEMIAQAQDSRLPLLRRTRRHPLRHRNRTQRRRPSGRVTLPPGRHLGGDALGERSAGRVHPRHRRGPV